MFEKEILMFKSLLARGIETGELNPNLDIYNAAFFLWEQSSMIPRNILILDLPKEKAHDHFEFIINIIFEGCKRRD